MPGPSSEFIKQYEALFLRNQPDKPLEYQPDPNNLSAKEYERQLEKLTTEARKEQAEPRDNVTVSHEVDEDRRVVRFEITHKRANGRTFTKRVTVSYGNKQFHSCTGCIHNINNMIAHPATTRRDWAVRPALVADLIASRQALEKRLAML